MWGTDITYLWTQEVGCTWRSSSTCISRRVVGWSMDKRMTKALVICALLMAANLRNPPRGLIHHSGRGSQYASHAILKQYSMIASMSRKSNCWNNAPIERFFRQSEMRVDRESVIQNTVGSNSRCAGICGGVTTLPPYKYPSAPVRTNAAHNDGSPGCSPLTYC